MRLTHAREILSTEKKVWAAGSWFRAKLGNGQLRPTCYSIKSIYIYIMLFLYKYLYIFFCFYLIYFLKCFMSSTRGCGPDTENKLHSNSGLGVNARLILLLASGRHGPMTGSGGFRVRRLAGLPGLFGEIFSSHMDRTWILNEFKKQLFLWQSPAICANGIDAMGIIEQK
jgi:hypothetical protein